MHPIKEVVDQVVDQVKQQHNGPSLTERRQRAQRIVLDKVGDATLHPKIAAKCVDAVFDGQLPRGDLFQLLDTVEAKRKAGHLEKPGAYFVVSLKRLFARYGIPWQTIPKRQEGNYLF